MDWWTVMEKYLVFVLFFFFLLLTDFLLFGQSLWQALVPWEIELIRKRSAGLEGCCLAELCICLCVLVYFNSNPGLAFFFFLKFCLNKEVPLANIVIGINWLCRSITSKKLPSVSRGQTQHKKIRYTLHTIQWSTKTHTSSVFSQTHIHKKRN